MSPKRLVPLISLILAGLACLWFFTTDPPATMTPPRSEEQPPRQRIRPNRHVVPTVPETNPEAPIFVAGSVRDLCTGESLVSAEVGLSSSAGLSAAVALATTRTDADGRFSFSVNDLTVPTRGYLSLHVSAEGYVPYDHAQALAPAPGESADVGVLRLTPGARVEGTVYLPSGAAADFGTIHLIDVLAPGRRGRLDGMRVQTTAKIREDGRFVTFVRGPHFVLQATVPEHAPGFTEVLSTESVKPVEIRLSRGTALEGRILDAEGNPIAKVNIAASVFTPRHGPDSRLGYYGGQWVSETDRDGDFSIAGLPPDSRLFLSCSHAEYRDVSVHRVTPDQFVEICMLSGRVLRASFVNSGGSSIFPSLVTLRTPEGESVRFWRDSASYVSECFRADSTAGQLGARGFLSQLVTWPPGTGLHDLGVVTLEVGPYIQVSLVNLEGHPVPGQIHAVPADSSGTPSNLVFALTQAIPYSTNKAGVATIGGLFDVPYDIVASSPNFTAGEIQAVPSVEGTAVVVTLRRPGSWSVCVTDVSGSPIANTEIELRDDESGFSAVSRAGAGGVVRFQQVPLQVALKAVARAQGFLSHAFPVTPLERSEGRTDSDIRLVRGIDVLFTVTSERGEPVSGALVSLKPEKAAADSDPEISTESLTDGEGHAHLRGLIPGKHRLVVSAIGRPAFEDVVHFAEGGAPVHVRLGSEAQWSVAGRVSYEGGSAVPNADVCLEPGEYPFGFSDRVCTQASSDGSFTLSLRKPLDGQVSLLVQWGCQEKVLMAESVDKLPSEVVVPRGADLIVYLVDEEQRPFLGEARFDVTNAEHEVSTSASYRPTSGTLHVEFKDLSTGPTRLNATAAGYRIKGSPWEAALDTGAQREVTLTAVPARSPKPFTTRVVDEFGRAVPAALVEVSPAEDDLVEGLFGSLYDSTWCQTNSRGVAEWLGFPDVKYTVSVSKRGFQEFEHQSLPTEQRTVTLKASATLWVEVNDELGVPAEDVRIHIRSLEGSEGTEEAAGLAEDLIDVWLPRLLPKELQESSDSLRYYCGLEPGKHRLRIKTDECFEHHQVVELAPEQSLTVEVVLPRAFEISGRTTLRGRPLPRTRIEAVSLDPGYPGVAVLETDQHGSFAAAFRRAGQYSFGLLESEGESPVLPIEVGPGSYVTLDFE